MKLTSEKKGDTYRNRLSLQIVKRRLAETVDKTEQESKNKKRHFKDSFHKIRGNEGEHSVNIIFLVKLIMNLREGYSDRNLKLAY